MEINERIKKLRSALGLSQKKFAEKISISNGYIAQIELSKCRVNERVIKLISYVFNVSKKWIETGEGEIFMNNEKGITFPSDEHRSFQNRIKYLRLSSGLSQEEFGEKIGISGPSISRLESGENVPSTQTILLICLQFNVDKNWLMGIDANNKLLRIGDRIKKIRNIFHLSQEEFGKRLKVSDSAISKLESGENNPSEQTISLIVSEFGVSERWIKTGEGEMLTSHFQNKENYGKGFFVRKIEVSIFDLLKAFSSVDAEQQQSVLTFFSILSNNKENTNQNEE